MITDKDKKQKLSQLSPKKYRVYGIFNFETNTLICVDLDIENVLFEFDIEGYNPSQYDIISFDVMLC